MTNIDQETRDLALKRINAMTASEIAAHAEQQRLVDRQAEAEKQRAAQESTERKVQRDYERTYEDAEREVVTAWTAFADALIKMDEAHRGAQLDGPTRDLVWRIMPEARSRILEVRTKLQLASPSSPALTTALDVMFGLRHMSFGSK